MEMAVACSWLPNGDPAWDFDGVNAMAWPYPSLWMHRVAAVEHQMSKS